MSGRCFTGNFDSLHSEVAYKISEKDEIVAVQNVQFKKISPKWTSYLKQGFHEQRFFFKP